MMADTAGNDSDTSAHDNQWRELWTDNRAKCDEAWKKLQGHTHAVLLAKGVQSTKDHQLAEDCVQLTYIKAFRSPKPELLANERLPWLFTILQRTLIDLARKRGRMLIKTGMEAAFGIAEPIDNLPSPPAQVEAHELRQQFMECLQKLPKNRRRAIEHKLQASKTDEQCAIELGIPPATFKSQISKGKRELKSCMQNLYERDSRK